MTLREFFVNVLTELNKRKAPSLILDDFNYFANKAITDYGNFKCNLYDLNQQSDDDLNALKIVDHTIDLTLQGLYYKGIKPVNYWHILNCDIIFEAVIKHSCYEIGDTLTKSASRLPTGPARHVKDNYYFKPSLIQPYFYSNLNLLEIRSGDVSKMAPKSIYIDYIKVPDTVILTQEELDEIPDNSQVLQFSKYVCDQIINEMVKLILENSSDPRLQSNIPVNQTISVPGQQTR